LHSGEPEEQTRKLGCFSFLCFFQSGSLNRSKQNQENEQASAEDDQGETIQHNDKETLLNSKNAEILSKALAKKNEKTSKGFLKKYKNLFKEAGNKDGKTRILNTLNTVFLDPNSSIDKSLLEELIKDCKTTIEQK
jgi:uncharacterized membrane protein YheB (UPF0754 family)